jgi:aspartyl-tRNA synthetase
MSSEPSPSASPSAAADQLAADLSASATLSKKQQKKDARKAEKAEKAAQRQQQQQTAAAAEEDPFAANYGDVPVEDVQSKAVSGRSWTKVGDLDEGAAGRAVLVRGAAQAIRPVSKKMAFVVLRQSMSTLQCVLVASADACVSTQMVKFATALSKESIVDIEGVVSLPKEPLKATTQQVISMEFVLCHYDYFLILICVNMVFVSTSGDPRMVIQTCQMVCVIYTYIDICSLSPPP